MKAERIPLGGKRARFIAFLGCDGSGKSAVIQGIKSHLEAAGYRVYLGHWMPRAVAVSYTRTENVENPHGKKPRGIVLSVLKLFWIWLNWRVTWARFATTTPRYHFVLFDRYHGDLIVDPKRYRYGGFLFLARLASLLMPQPDQIILLDAPVDVLLKRKREMSASELSQLREAYFAYCQRNSCSKIVDASQPVEKVIQAALQSLMQKSKGEQKRGLAFHGDGSNNSNFRSADKKSLHN